jgi:hypothetical protein
MSDQPKIVHQLHAPDFTLAGESKHRRPRKPRIDRAIAQAEKAGKTVTGITTPDGVTLTFGDEVPTESSNEWDEALRRGKH